MIRQILAIFDFLCHVKIHKNKNEAWSSIFQTNTKNSDEVIFSLSFLLVSKFISLSHQFLKLAE